MNRIRELRELAGLTLEQVAQRVGTSFQQVQRLEKGERGLTDKWMVRLAPALGVQPCDLLPFPAEPPGQEDGIRKRLEPIVIQLWRIQDRRGMETALRVMAPPGFKMPAFEDAPDDARRPRKRK